MVQSVTFFVESRVCIDPSKLLIKICCDQSVGRSSAKIMISRYQFDSIHRKPLGIFSSVWVSQDNNPQFPNGIEYKKNKKTARTWLILHCSRNVS
jgi:hypothetical protein